MPLFIIKESSIVWRHHAGLAIPLSKTIMVGSSFWVIVEVTDFQFVQFFFSFFFEEEGDDLQAISRNWKSCF